MTLDYGEATVGPVDHNGTMLIKATCACGKVSGVVLQADFWHISSDLYRAKMENFEKSMRALHAQADAA